MILTIPMTCCDRISSFFSYLTKFVVLKTAAEIPLQDQAGSLMIFTSSFQVSNFSSYDLELLHNIYLYISISIYVYM